MLHTVNFKRKITRHTRLTAPVSYEHQENRISMCDDTGFMSRSDTIMAMFTQGEINQLLNQYTAERIKQTGKDIPASVLALKNQDKVDILDNLANLREQVKTMAESRRNQDKKPVEVTQDTAETGTQQTAE